MQKKTTLPPCARNSFFVLSLFAAKCSRGLLTLLMAAEQGPLLHRRRNEREERESCLPLKLLLHPGFGEGEEKEEDFSGK